MSPRDIAERRGKVLRLRQQGLSFRDIARRLDTSDTTVRFDILALIDQGHQFPDRITCLDGVNRPAGHTPEADAQEPPLTRRQREPGEAPCRCFWCGAWKCQKPLSLCSACERWYYQARRDMPERNQEDAAYHHQEKS